MSDFFSGAFSPRFGVYRYKDSKNSRTHYVGTHNFANACLRLKADLGAIVDGNIERLKGIGWHPVSEVGAFGEKESNEINALLVQYGIKKSDQGLSAFSRATGLNRFFIQNYLLNSYTKDFAYLSPATFSFIKNCLRNARAHRLNGEPVNTPIFLPHFLSLHPEIDLSISEMNFRQFGVYQFDYEGQLIHFTARSPFDVLRITNKCCNVSASLKRLDGTTWVQVNDCDFYETKYILIFQILFDVCKEFYLQNKGRKNGVAKFFSELIQVSQNRLQFANIKEYQSINTNYSLIPNEHVIHWTVIRLLESNIIKQDFAENLLAQLSKKEI